MNKKNRSILYVVLWMLFIFTMSNFNGEDSGKQSNFFVNIITNILNINNIELISFIVRKLAHFTEYMILGFLISNMNKYNHKRYRLGVFICIIYATLDEIHQIFIPGRAFQIRDILIDILGSLVGIYTYMLFIRRRNGLQ